MLAQNFQTPEALGITDVEFSSLVTVLGMLERGEIRAREFYMDRVHHDCGSPSCLLGWASFVSDGKAFDCAVPLSVSCITDLTQPLRDLFAFGAHSAAIYLARPAHAAIALRSFLSTGSANWPEAMRSAA